MPLPDPWKVCTLKGECASAWSAYGIKVGDYHDGEVALEFPEGFTNFLEPHAGDWPLSSADAAEYELIVHREDAPSADPPRRMIRSPGLNEDWLVIESAPEASPLAIVPSGARVGLRIVARYRNVCRDGGGKRRCESFEVEILRGTLDHPKSIGALGPESPGNVHFVAEKGMLFAHWGVRDGLTQVAFHAKLDEAPRWL